MYDCEATFILDSKQTAVNSYTSRH